MSTPNSIQSDLGRELLQGVLNDPNNPEPKAVYGDWLEENGYLDMAYAYHWAATNNKSPEQCFGDWYSWYSTVSPECGAHCYLPTSELFDAVSANHGGKFENYTYEEAFIALATGLKQLRESGEQL